MRLLTFLASRFVAGDTAEEAMPVVRRLNEAKIETSLDILGENVNSREEAVAYTDHYIRLLDLIRTETIRSHVSIKLTMLGLDIGEDLCYENARRIVSRAREHDNFIRIDMEGSDYTTRTLDIFYRLRAEFDNLGIVIQSMLKRSEQDIAEIIRRGGRVRLCKGAYKEPSAIAFPDKREVNRNYLKLAGMLLEADNYPAFATHDERMIQQLAGMVRERAMQPEQFEFQMLFGLRRKSWYVLRQDGYNMRIYVPFGTHWFPYYYRRLRERKENVFFILNNLFRS